MRWPMEPVLARRNPSVKRDKDFRVAEPDADDAEAQRRRIAGTQPGLKGFLARMPFLKVRPGTRLCWQLCCCTCLTVPMLSKLDMGVRGALPRPPLPPKNLCSCSYAGLLDDVQMHHVLICG